MPSRPPGTRRARGNEAALPDHELVRYAQRGSVAAFEELVSRHHGKVYGLAISILEHETDATEMAQEAWVRCWRHLRRFRGEAAFLTWLRRIVTHLCVDEIRRQKRQRALSLEELEEERFGSSRLPCRPHNPAWGLEGKELREWIRRALRQLSPEHRTVLVLHEFEDMSYKETARCVHCSVGTVMSRLFYARRRMARLLTQSRPAQFCCPTALEGLRLSAAPFLADGELLGTNAAPGRMAGVQLAEAQTCPSRHSANISRF